MTCLSALMACFSAGFADIHRAMTMYFMSRRIVVTMLAAVMPFAAALCAIVKGSVTDLHKEALPGAIIKVEGIEAVAATDKEGRYKLDIKPGTYKITASMSGFLSATKTIKLTAKGGVVDFTLKESSRELEGVSITAASGSRKIKESALTANALDVKTRTASISDLSSVVDRSAGVKVRRQGGVGSDLDISVNGLGGNSVRYFIDGMPLETRGTQVNLQNIPVNLVDRIEVYKGVVPSYLSSDALGGAINIVTNRSSRSYLDASLGVGSFHTYSGDIAGQFFIPQTTIAVRPSFGVNYSKNDYVMKGVEVWNEDAHQYENSNRRRFHDDYISVMGQIEAGVNNANWADQFFIGGGYSYINKELQTGAMQNKVYGSARRKAHAWNIFARYSKRFGSVNTYMRLSHTWDHSETVDTALRKYSWNGTWMPASGNEITGKAPSDRLYRRPITVMNAGADYTLNYMHSLSFNFMLNRTGNKRFDIVDDSFEPSNDVLTKYILSLTYTQNLLSGRMLNTFFVKDYINEANIRQNDNPTVSGAAYLEKRHSVKNYFGAGAATRYRFYDPLQVKASYEHSVRLPLSRELLGNGTTIMPNLLLRPESSENVNVGIFGNAALGDGDHRINYEVGYFMRHVKDYIRASVSEREGVMMYENVPAVRVNGIDAEIGYTWRGLNISLNGSYNDSRDLKKYKTDGKPSATYKNRVPNKPWLYANAEASYTFRNLMLRQDKMRIGIMHQWIHWYYLNWEAYGAVESKASIPEQNITSLSLTYSLKNDRYSISIDLDNIFDSTAYDNYMLQKPGRSIFAKFRIFLN